MLFSSSTDRSFSKRLSSISTGHYDITTPRQNVTRGQPLTVTLGELRDMCTLLRYFSLWLQRMKLAQRRVMTGGRRMLAALSAPLFCIVRHAGRLLRPPHGALQPAHDQL